MSETEAALRKGRGGGVVTEVPWRFSPLAKVFTDVLPFLTLSAVLNTDVKEKNEKMHVP